MKLREAVPGFYLYTGDLINITDASNRDDSQARNHTDLTIPKLDMWWMGWEIPECVNDVNANAEVTPATILATAELQKLSALLREVKESGVEHGTSNYVSIQLDRQTWKEIQSL